MTVGYHWVVSMGLSVPHAWRSCAASAPGPAQLTIFRRSEHAWRNCAASAPYSLNLDALDLVERDLVAGRRPPNTDVNSGG